MAVIPHLLAHLPLFIGTGVLVAVAGVVGNWTAHRTGLTTLILDGALTGRPFVRRAVSVAGLAVGLGVVTAVVVVALNAVLFANAAPTSAPPFWTGGLAALYGGLTEEILIRYGAMSLIAWLLTRVPGAPTAHWAAIAGAAALLGLWHLPATAAAVPLTPLVVTRTIALTALAGVVFGWIYWRRGLEAAMVSHAAAALILHVAVPRIGF